MFYLTKYKKNCCAGAVFFLSGLFLFSCQKDINRVDDQIFGRNYPLDSLLLVREISMDLVDPVSGLPYGDSTIEHYQYDSVNRQITLNWTDFSGNLMTGISAVFTYHADGLLSGVEYKFPTGYTPTSADLHRMKLEYDNQQVIQRITKTFGNGATESTVFQKTLLAGGNYQLEWAEANDEIPSLPVLRRAAFDAAGRCLISEADYHYPSGLPGSVAREKRTDSLHYTPDGNLGWVFRTLLDSATNTRDTFMLAEFYTRKQKGDNLFNQREMLMQGISNIPLDAYSLHFSGLFGILSYLPGDVENKQYMRYPYELGQLYNFGTGGYEVVQSLVVIDPGYDRLLIFRGFFHDANMIQLEYRIRYYK